MKNVFSILAVALLTLGLFSYGTENSVDTEAQLQALQTSSVNPNPGTDCPDGPDSCPFFIAERVNQDPCGPGGDDCPFIAERVNPNPGTDCPDGPDSCPFFIAEQVS